MFGVLTLCLLIQNAVPLQRSPEDMLKYIQPMQAQNRRALYNEAGPQSSEIYSVIPVNPDSNPTKGYAGPSPVQVKDVATSVNAENGTADGNDKFLNWLKSMMEKNGKRNETAHTVPKTAASVTAVNETAPAEKKTNITNEPTLITEESTTLPEQAKPAEATEEEVQNQTRNDLPPTTDFDPNRRMNWWDNIFKVPEDRITRISTISISNSTILSPHFYDHKPLTGARSYDISVTQVIDDLKLILDKLNDNLAKVNENLEKSLKEVRAEKYLVVKFPMKPKNQTGMYTRSRSKRDVSVAETKKYNESIENSGKYNNSKAKLTTIHTAQNNLKLETNNEKTNVQLQTSDTVNATYSQSNKPDETKNEPTVNYDQHKKHPVQAVRETPDLNVTCPSKNNIENCNRESIKYKLLSHIDTGIEVFKDKFASLNKIKVAFEHESAFKVGYITANLDTLLMSLDKLKDEMTAKKDTWDEKKVLQVFEKINKSNRIADKLIEALQAFSVPVEVNVLNNMVAYDYLDY